MHFPVLRLLHKQSLLIVLQCANLCILIGWQPLLPIQSTGTVKLLYSLIDYTVIGKSIYSGYCYSSWPCLQKNVLYL